MPISETEQNQLLKLYDQASVEQKISLLEILKRMCDIKIEKLVQKTGERYSDFLEQGKNI